MYRGIQEWKQPENTFEDENGNRTDLLGRVILLCLYCSNQMLSGCQCSKCGFEY